MEGIGSEVSHKIRAAIKAKLIELGAYIDDELPDYIMVMVANKRSRHQMDEDLQLFLGSNTKIFTSWLHTVLQKLQEVTIANFDLKKDSDINKRKRKSSNSDESARKERKSSEEKSKSSKKHSKKHKGGKKLKKSKNKSKEKLKEKNGEKKHIQTDYSERNLEKSADAVPCTASGIPIISHNEGNIISGDIKNSDLKLDNQNIIESCNRTDKLKRVRHDRSGSLGKSSSVSADEQIVTKVGKDLQADKSNDHIIYSDRNLVIEDEFNIEPLQPNESNCEINEKMDYSLEGTGLQSQDLSTGMTIKAPTRELLKEHNKIISQAEENILKGQKKSNEGSEESLSPEEIRKQLLLSRAKKKLEQSKIPGRMRSNSPDIEVLENITDTRDNPFSSHRHSSSTRRLSEKRDYEDEDQNSKDHIRDGKKLSRVSEDRRMSPTKCKYDNYNGLSTRTDEKKNIISISKSLEMEKNLGIKSDGYRRSKRQESCSPKRKPVPSRIVTIPEPEAPEIPSIVKVKPREYVPKDKQANKVLILKAVADAEKSIATVHSRNDSEVETRKPEGLFTKDLRGKRYEKLAVTLSNVHGGPSDRDKAKRMVSVDSENTNALNRKAESVKDSELSQGFKSIHELTLKNISNKSEDQFISSKTSAMEKNDKYIHCWLEGVEKAVKDEEIVNPSEMDDFHGRYSEEDKGKEDDENSLKEEEKKRKKSRNDEDSPVDDNSKNRRSGEKNTTNTKTNQDDGPQIVVTLDGLTSKAIKDIILRNRDTPNGPLLAGKKGEKSKDVEEGLEGNTRIRYKGSDLSKNAGTSRLSESDSRDKSGGFEKISERFGRINKTSENHEYKEKYYEFERERYEKKYLKYQGTDKEKHYEKLKDKYASAGESKNKKLIAKLSEKFGKVDREFEDKKRKYSDDDVRLSYSSRRVDRPMDRGGKYVKLIGRR